jgi:hypothetical protein
MPDQLRVVCLDDGTELNLGNGADAKSTYEIHGPAPALLSIFSGNSVFGQDLLDGKLYAVGSLQHASVLTGSFLEWMMRACA